jgi:hypothetical protein
MSVSIITRFHRSHPVALLSIACPECGARVKSSKGFKRGEAVSCPKCETDFTVGDSTSADENLEWSYKNSWLRFAVLGVLLVVLGVLGYMLYDKKRNEGKDTAGGGGDDEDTARLVEPRIVGPAPEMKLLPVNPAGGPGPRKAKTEPKPQTTDEMKQALVGTWEAKRRDETHTVEYRADGSFIYSVEKGGAAGKTIEGQWKLAPDQPMPIRASNIRIEWTPEGTPVVKDTVVLNLDGTLGHPLLDQRKMVGNPLALFTKKK